VRAVCKLCFCKGVETIPGYYSRTPLTILVVWWSKLLTTNHEVPGWIPGSAVGIFPCRGRSPHLVELRFKARPGTPRSHISSLTLSGQRNRALWEPQPQKSVTLRHNQDGEPRSPYGHLVALGEKKVELHLFGRW
jgi:hypothetical protein